MHIRRYAPRDRGAVRAICKMTALERYAKSEARKEEMCFLFLDYFLDFEPEHAFVAVTDEDEVVGYICGSLNYRLYKEKMHSIYDKKIKRVSLLHHFFSKSMTFLAKRLSDRYGVCMHMNVAPSYQHQRIGLHLLNSLKEDCKSAGAKGLFLVTRNRGTTGYPFYIHNGFKEGRDFLFGSLALVYPLIDEEF
jgi:GNAT superfamily N-acetyltransferase